MTKGVIEVRDLRHAYGDFIAVDGIGFSVWEGEIFSFLGPNGAGKSTAINLLITLLSIQSGSAEIAGFDVAQEPSRVRESLGIVFQEVTLDRDMTVRETLEFHGMLYNMDRDDRKKRIDELLALVQLEGKRDTLTKHLSGGMKRRLEIARGLMTRPKVLFLDEPTIGLDPQTRMRMWDYIRNVNREGTTIFLTTHYMDEADQLSDRISIIDHGKIIVTGTPAELKNTLGKDLLYFETSDNIMAATVLQEFPAVRTVTDKASGFVVRVSEDGTHLLPDMMERLIAEKIEVTTVNMKKPSMDDVFLHYTGKEIRDEETGKRVIPNIRPGGR
ncbi:MAG: ATP-binding cassette domain-containing protein [Methanoregulaceae archaeon]